MSKSTSIRPSQKGFTIIELLVATVVFSIVLVAVLASFVQISRLFYKGVNMSNTQSAARTITKDIESDISFGATLPSNVDASSTGSDVFCVGAHRYTYYLGNQVGSSPQAGIYRESITNGCPTLAQQALNTGSAEQLLSNGMQLNHLFLNCGNGRCRIGVHLVFYGGSSTGLFGSASSHNPAYQAADAECTGDLTSSQYCATATYNRTVLQRI